MQKMWKEIYKWTDWRIFFLFNKYRGHISIYESNQNTLKQFVDEFFKLISLKDYADLIESNQKLRHKFLLYGFTLIQLIKEIY